jgi:hypothetical protein
MTGSFRKRIKFLFTRDGLSNVPQKFLIVFGVVWLMVEPFSWFYPAMAQYKELIFGLSAAVVLLATLHLSFPRVEHEKKWEGKNVTIKIKVGKLFEEPGNIAIGCNECFDTEAPGAISANSLIAQLVKSRFDNKRDDLDRDISAALAALTPAPYLDRRQGKKQGYPIGTVAVIAQGAQKIFLTAFTKAYPTQRSMSKEELWGSLNKLWEVVRERAYVDEPIAVPVWGGGLAGFPGSRLMLIQLILLSFAMATRADLVSRNLTLVIYDNDYDPHEFRKAAETLDALEF